MSREIRDFWQDHRDVLRKFYEKAKEIDTINFNSENIEAEIIGRRIAQDMIFDWLQEIASIGKGDLYEEFQEEEQDWFKELEENKVEPQD